jgi:hypothetical protein
VVEREREEIAVSRTVRYQPGDTPPNVEATYVGVALSGGGIRSATFSLGLLQGMHRLGVLRTVDYLSTVSGGGFTGGWWTAWLNRDGLKTTDPHFPSPEQPEVLQPPSAVDERRRGDGARFAGRDPIHHLRLFANYITPRKGLLSGDTWRAAAVFSRNLALTWLVLLPILCIVVLLGQLYFVMQPFDNGVVDDFVHLSAKCPSHPPLLPDGTRPECPVPDRKLHGFDTDLLADRAVAAAWPLLALLVLMGVATALWMHFNNGGPWYMHAAVAIALLSVVTMAGVVYKPEAATREWWQGPSTLWRDFGWQLVLAAVTVVVGVLIGLNICRGGPDGSAVTNQTKANRATQWQTQLLGTFAATTVVLAFAGFAHEFLVQAVMNLADLPVKKWTWKEVTTVIGTLLGTVSTVYTVFVSTPSGGRDKADVKKPQGVRGIILAVAPVLALLLFGMAAALVMHWVMYDVLVRDGRLPPLAVCAWVSMLLALGLALWENEQVADFRRGLRRLCGLALVVLLAVVAAAPWVRQAWSIEHSRPLRWIAFALAFAVIVGLAWPPQRNGRVRALLAFIAVFLLAWMTVRLEGFDAHWTSSSPGERAVALQIGLATVASFMGWVLALGWMADPNALSLHTFYRSRLVRAYLGASNAARHARDRDIAEPDSNDDMPLAAVRNSRHGGPYPLINTTLNLVGGRDLVTAQRSAASFVLAPLHCGSRRTGFRDTATYMQGGLTLGAALATSGAAVSPNMGSATPSAALALLLAAFNIRLGLWVPTPDEVAWTMAQTRLWPYYLLRESLSQTNDLGTYCYLTDGGHFDNSGLYSLVERGCRYIILSDNGADYDRCFADVGEAIRRCRIDFRAEIHIDTRDFRPADGGASATHVAFGTIVYDEDHLRAIGWPAVSAQDRVGRLVWIKPTLLASDRAGDVRQYGLENDRFPQQSTVDQWFDESQFESYRTLGEISAEAAFGNALGHVPLTVTSNGREVPLRLTSAIVHEFFESVCVPAAKPAPVANEQWWRPLANLFFPAPVSTSSELGFSTPW